MRRRATGASTGYKRSSEILMGIALNNDLSANLTYRIVLNMLGERAFGIVLIFFALPSALPLSALPGISFLFSLPIAIFSFQMIIARKTLWLPKAIADRTVSHDIIAKVIHKSVPFLQKIEHLSRPRLPVMTSRGFEIINGVIIFCLSLLLMLPIPFSNFIFSGLIILFGLGFVEKDGLFIMTAYVGTIVYLAFIYYIIFSVLKAMFF